MTNNQHSQREYRHKTAYLPERRDGIVQHHDGNGAEGAEDVGEAEFGERDGQGAAEGLTGPGFFVGGAPAVRGS